MVDHRSIERRSVAVVLAIHLVEIVGLAQLNQTAGISVSHGIAGDKLQRTTGQGSILCFVENSGKRLLPHRQNRRELLIAADSAALNLRKLSPDAWDHSRRVDSKRSERGRRVGGARHARYSSTRHAM